ncbi:MAG: helix-turn-helix domain-containing protein [Steroidobacteraceae bacterium]|jgi:excisionase family DNA binding protein
MNCLMGTKEVAVRLGVSERTAARMMQDGSLQAFQLRGKLWRTTHAALESYIDRMMVLGRPVYGPGL